MRPKAPKAPIFSRNPDLACSFNSTQLLIGDLSWDLIGKVSRHRDESFLQIYSFASPFHSGKNAIYSDYVHTTNYVVLVHTTSDGQFRNSKGDRGETLIGMKSAAFPPSPPLPVPYLDLIWEREREREGGRKRGSLSCCWHPHEHTSANKAVVAAVQSNSDKSEQVGDTLQLLNYPRDDSLKVM